MPQPYFTPGKDPVPIAQEAGWDPGPVWTGAENLATTGIRSLDRLANSQSLYRLHYPTHLIIVKCTLNTGCSLIHFILASSHITVHIYCYSIFMITSMATCIPLQN